MANIVRNLGIGKRRKQNIDRAVQESSTGTTGTQPSIRAIPEARISNPGAANANTQAKQMQQASTLAAKKKRKGIRRKSFGQSFSGGPTLSGGNL